MLNRRQFVSTTAGLAASLSLAACAGSSGDSSAETGAATTEAGSTEGKKVVFMVNGNLGDKGFYDATAEGVNRLASDYGCETKIVEMGRDETTYETYLRDVSDQDWDLIIGSTYSVQEVLETVAADYPDKTYLIVDVASGASNILGVTFPGCEAGFLAGCLAALHIQENAPDNKVAGFIGSMDSQGINDFLVGYIQGVDHIDSSIKVNTSYVGSFEDVATCLEMTTQLYNQGAEVVYAPASQSIMGAVTASANCGKAFIGCDTDIYTELIDSQPELVEHVLSSSLKRMGDAVVEASTGLWDGSMQAGETYDMDIAHGAISLADNDNYQSLVSEATRTQLDEISSQIASGSLEVTSVYDMEDAEVVEMREGKKA